MISLELHRLILLSMIFLISFNFSNISAKESLFIEPKSSYSAGPQDDSRKEVTSRNREIEAFMALGEFEGVIFPFKGQKTIEQIRSLGDFVKLKSKNDFFEFKISVIFGVSSDRQSAIKGRKEKASSYPEIVVPYKVFLQESQLKFPKGLNPQAILIELFSKASGSEGTSKIKIEFQGSEKFRDEKYSLKIKLYPFAIPRRLNFNSSFGFAPWVVTLKHFGKWTDKVDFVFNQYFQLAGEHRIDLHKFHTSAANGKNQKLKVLDYKLDQLNVRYTELWKGMYSGRDSDYGFKSNITDLPLGSKELKNLKLAKKLNSEIEQIKNQFFLYPYDEPKKNDFSRIFKEIKSIKKTLSNANILLTTGDSPELFDAIDWWVPNVFNIHKMGLNRFRQLKKRFKKVFFYTSCNSHGCDDAKNLNWPDFVIDREPARIRSIPWFGFFHQLDGFLYYDTVRGYLESDFAPYVDPFLFTGLGEGNLFYPCNLKLCSTNQQLVFPSMRLKIYRDGLEDFEILRLAKQMNINLDRYEALFNNFEVNQKDLEFYQNTKRELLEKMMSLQKNKK